MGNLNRRLHRRSALLGGAGLMVLGLLAVQGCSFSAPIVPMPNVQETAVTDPVERTMLANAEFAAPLPIYYGPSVIEIINAEDRKILVIVRRGDQLGRAFVEQGRSRAFAVADGCYQIYFIVADAPEILDQAEGACLYSQHTRITFLSR